MSKQKLNRGSTLYENLSLFSKLHFLTDSYPQFSGLKISSEEQISTLPLNFLKLFFINESNASWETTNKNKWYGRVASTRDILSDIRLQQTRLISSDLESNIRLRSIPGHAASGHKQFYQNPKPNTSPFDIIRRNVLKDYLNEQGQPYYQESKKISARDNYLLESQRLIDTIAELLERALYSSEKTIALEDSKGKPLFDFPIFYGKVDSYALLQGYFYGGFFDNYDDIRFSVEKKYLFPVHRKAGGGEEFLLNKENVAALNLGLDELARDEYLHPLLAPLSFSTRIKLLEELNIIVPQADVDYANTSSWKDILSQGHSFIGDYKHIPQYVRKVKGRGGSDDVLMCLANFIDFNPKKKSRNASWYSGLQVGAWLADFIDTIEKATAIFLPGGQDESLARYINIKWLERVRIDNAYRSLHSISLRKLEHRLEKEGREDFALVPKDTVVDLTAAGINPLRKYYKSGSGNIIHSSENYLLRLQSVNANLIRANRIPHVTDYITTTLEQEFLFMRNYLEKEHAISMKTKDGSYFVRGTSCSNSEVLVGFDNQPLGSVKQYMLQHIFPLVVDPNSRSEKIANFYAVSSKK